jgi:DNA-directed RNA polymerase subunit RPC12/RpoP
MAATSSRVSESLHPAEPFVTTQTPEQPSKKRGQREPVNGKTQFKCIDCSNEITFSRKSDLDRHQRLKHSHGDHPRFVCNAQGCFIGQVPRTFARSDKLTSHIKTRHNLDTIFSRCPFERCTFGPCALEVLGIHLQRAHRPYEVGRAVLNATSCKALRCPLWRCGKHVSVEKLLHHVASHAKEEIDSAKPSLELLWLLVQSTPDHLYDVTVQVICPICHTVSADIEQFTEHLLTAHLFTPESGGSEHFDNWKVCLAQNVIKAPRCQAAVHDLLPWSCLDRVESYNSKRDIRCPSCPFSVAGVAWRGSGQQDKWDAIEKHHLSLLRPEAEVVEEIYPYRMQILRLWPEFVTHPVFADFDQPRQQTESGLSQAQPSFLSHVNDDFGITDWTAHDFVPRPVLADFDQQSKSGPFQAQPSFPEHLNNDFETPDWTTYNFNTPM